MMHGQKNINNATLVYQI